MIILFQGLNRAQVVHKLYTGESRPQPSYTPGNQTLMQDGMHIFTGEEREDQVFQATMNDSIMTLTVPDSNELDIPFCRLKNMNDEITVTIVAWVMKSSSDVSVQYILFYMAAFLLSISGNPRRQTRVVGIDWVFNGLWVCRVKGG